MAYPDYAAKEAADLVARLTKNAAAWPTRRLNRRRSRLPTKARRSPMVLVIQLQKVADGLRSELQTAAKEKMAVSAALKEAKAQSEITPQGAGEAVERGETVSRQLADARKQRTARERDGEVDGARDEQTKARSTAEADLKKSRETTDAARAELAKINKRLEQAVADKAVSDEASSVAHSQAEAAEAKLLGSPISSSRAPPGSRSWSARMQNTRRRIGIAVAPRGHRPRGGQRRTIHRPVARNAGRLLAAFQALAGSGDHSDVLATFVEQLAAQFPAWPSSASRRTTCRGRTPIGFDLKTDIGKVVMPLGMDSLLARAVSSGQI